MTLEVLNPLGEVKVKKQALVGREKNLQGKTVVLFSNGKANVGLLFDNLERLLSSQFPSTRTVRKGKKNVALPAPAAVLQETANEADLVICGIGD